LAGKPEGLEIGVVEWWRWASMQLGAAQKVAGERLKVEQV